VLIGKREPDQLKLGFFDRLIDGCGGACLLVNPEPVTLDKIHRSGCTARCHQMPSFRGIAKRRARTP
jgi:hypothetical protein